MLFLWWAAIPGRDTWSHRAHSLGYAVPVYGVELASVERVVDLPVRWELDFVREGAGGLEDLEGAVSEGV